MGIIVNDITRKVKQTYNLSVIHGNINYDRSKETIRQFYKLFSRQGSVINVNGSIFNILFSFGASVSKYSGHGTAKIDGMTISYTKVVNTLFRPLLSRMEWQPLIFPMLK